MWKDQVIRKYIIKWPIKELGKGIIKVSKDTLVKKMASKRIYKCTKRYVSDNVWGR